jgi:polyisoprenoid-binding protein YceI
MAPSEQMAAPGLPELLKDTALAGDWVLNPSQSTVSLKNKSVWGLVPVTGVFHQVAGHGTVSRAGEVTGAVIVGAASVDTRNARRDNHLRSADFFDSRNYPDITFAVTHIRPSGPGVTVTGMLCVRGRARPLTLELTAAIHGDAEVSLDAAVSINQADFGLTWNFLGAVAKTTTILVHAVFTRPNRPSTDG